jgi:hypothetical protein
MKLRKQAAEPGGGKYDPELETLLESTRAAGVVLMVIGGPRGDGFAYGSVSHLPPKTIAGMLRQVADSLEKGAVE